MWYHRNLRLFDAQRRIISHQPADLFVRVWHAYEELNYVCGTGARVLVCACVVLAIDRLWYVCYSPAIVCGSYVFEYNL